MTELRLSLAVGDYDITRPLIDGTVAAQGVKFTVTTAPSPQRHWRMLKHHEFDVCELSLGSYVALCSRGDDRLTAIPVFPHRRFRHGYLFVPASSPVESPAGLSGATIGVRSWQTTMGVWLRGILDEMYGLPLTSVRWLAQDAEDVALTLPGGLSLEQVEPGRTVVERCAAGELGGLIYPEIPGPVLSGDGTMRRVFADPKQAEQEYYRRTGIFPIMHVVAVRRSLLAENPWLGRNLMQAFERAKQAAFQRLVDPRTVSLAWLRALQEEERALLGDDPWQYGLGEANRKTLATFLKYALAQGVAAKELQPGELFFPATVDRPPAYV